MSDRVVVPFPVKPPTEFKIESGVPIPPIGEAGSFDSFGTLNELIGLLQKIAKNRPDLVDKPVHFQAGIDLAAWDTSDLDDGTVTVACDVGMVGVSGDNECCTLIGGSVPAEDD